MSHTLFRVLETLWNTPHLITETALHPIVDYLQARNMGQLPMLTIVPDAKVVDEDKPAMLGEVGEIKIDGVLTYKPIYGLCGPSGTSYQGILEQASTLIDNGISTLILTHSSPGGQAGHCFSTALELREMCDEAGVKLISYIDTLSASASLAIGVVADEVIIHPSASTGSIGCVLALMDKSKAMSNAGLKPIYIASTPGKTPFNDDGSFSKEALQEAQEEVTRLGNDFAEHVAMHTGIPTEDVIAMDAKVYHAAKALELGLVNAVMDHKQFAAYIASIKGAK